MQTNWRDFGIGMASGVAFCFVLYFGWGLISPHRPEPTNVVTSNAAVGMDENALIAANAERPINSSTTNVTPPPQLRPEPAANVAEPRVILAPEDPPRPVARPRPRPEPDDLPPDDEPGLDDDGGKPDY